MDMISLVHSSRFQVLCSSTIILNSSWHPASNQALVQSQDLQGIGHCGKEMTSTKVVMAGLKMIPPPQFTGGAPLSPSATQGPPSLLRNDPAIQWTSSSSSPPWPPSGSSRKPPSSVEMKRFQPPSEQWKPDVARVTDLSSVLGLSHNRDDTNNYSDDLLDLGGKAGIASISLKQKEFSMKQLV